jgi:hypothetical protein
LSPVCEISFLDDGDLGHDVVVLFLHSVSTVVLVLFVVRMFVGSVVLVVLMFVGSVVVMGEAASVGASVTSVDGFALGFGSCAGSCTSW